MKKSVVAILTNFQDFNPGYSLSGIVVDQALMLVRRGHTVHIFVNEHFNPARNADARITSIENEFPDKIFIHKRSKFMHLKDYAVSTQLSNDHKLESEEAGRMYAEDFMKNGVNVVFTHDFVFTGWNLPYALAVRQANSILSASGRFVMWYHWIHSVPSGGRDWWVLDVYGPNHSLVFPNRTEINRVAESYRTNVSRVKLIPHIKDIRTWYDFGEESMDFTSRYPKIMDSDIVQVYPCSTDRLFAKQLDIVLRIFGFMKEAGASVFLVVANQWATGRQRKEDLKKYFELAEHYKLVEGEDFVFTSEISSEPEMDKILRDSGNLVQLEGLLGEDFEKIRKHFQNTDFESNIMKAIEKLQKYPTGISRRMLRELQLLSSVFIFPTKEESFGLVGPEAAMSGCLPVINRSLTMMFEVMGHWAPAYDFGSFHQNTPDIANDDYIRAVAHSILNRIYQNESVQTKMFCRKRYNMDSIYNRYYLPILV